MKIYLYSPDATAISSNLKIQSDLIEEAKNGLGCWIHSVYFYLKTYLNIQLVDDIPDEGIILYHSGFFPKNIKPTGKQYFICVQADYGRSRYAQMHLVQNPYQSSNLLVNKRIVTDSLFSFSSIIFIPLWVQPSIIPRSIERGYEISNVKFLGNIEQLNPAEKDKLYSAISSCNLNFIPVFNYNEWNDYSSCDIVLALRDFNNNPYYYKPFSKIVNAIMADTLVISGNESSSKYFKKHFYKQLPIVKTTNDLISSLNKIKDNPEAAFISLTSVKTKINQLSNEFLLYKWIDIFKKSELLFDKWKMSSNFKRELFYKSREI
jgi:hypothetical protein